MRRFYPLILTGILCSITHFGYSQWNTTHTVGEKDVIPAGTYTVSPAGSITYTSINSYNYFSVTNNSTVVIDLGGNTLFLRGDDSSDGIDIVVEEGSTLKIIGNVDLGGHSDFRINGNLIVSGNITCYGTYGGYNMEIFMGENGILAIGGDAGFKDSKGQNQENIYVIGDVTQVGSDFDNVNQGSDPFSTTKALDFDAVTASIDLWDSTKLVTADRASNAVNINLLSDLAINSASGWYDKYLKVTAYGFDTNEVSLPDQSGGEIKSLAELKTRIKAVKWEVKDATVCKELDEYHDKSGSDVNHITSAENTTMQTYLSKNRKIVIEFVDTEGEVITTYPSYSGSRMNTVEEIMTIEEVEVQNGMGDLPIVLSQFTTEVKGNKVVLNWTTAMEINNDYFEILRSSDTKEWEVIGIIEGAGNTKYSIDYEFVDDEPLTTAYYKLIQYDFDGKNETFGPLSVELENKNRGESFEVNLFPNLLSRNQNSQLSIQDIPSKSNLTIEIFNKVGVRVFEKEFKDLSSNSLLTTFLMPQNLPSGMYYVVAKSGKEISKNKLVLK